MDWLDEVINKLFSKKRTLRQLLFLYLLAALFFILFLTIITNAICVSWEKLLINNDQQFDPLFSFLTWRLSDYISGELPQKLAIIEIIRHFSVLVYTFFVLYFVSITFYKRKLLYPVKILEASIKEIEKGNFYLQSYYSTNDEFEGIFHNLDRLRKQIKEKNEVLEKIYLNQKKVNAAFSHDLRTPLSIILNNLDLLELYSEQNQLNNHTIEEISGRIRRSTTRLVNFSTTMQSIQRLEEIPVNKSIQPIENIEKSISEVTNQAHGKQVFITKNLHNNVGNYDLSIINEVFENLFNNALRYSKTEINIILEVQQFFLIIYIKDDGPGFTKEALEKATDPYYSQTKNSNFGLGLTIAEVLTKKHDGNLKLTNSIDKGALITATFSLK